MVAKPKKRRKTETIKERAIYVYLPSLGMVRDWKSRAEKVGSISKFVIERVEDSIRREEGEEGYCQLHGQSCKAFSSTLLAIFLNTDPMDIQEPYFRCSEAISPSLCLNARSF